MEIDLANQPFTKIIVWLTQERKVLLVPDPRQPVWYPVDGTIRSARSDPGGGVQTEPPLVAAVRRVAVETGLRLEPHRFWWVGECAVPESFDSWQRMAIYTVELRKDERPGFTPPRRQSWWPADQPGLTPIGEPWSWHPIEFLTGNCMKSYAREECVKTFFQAYPRVPEVRKVRNGDRWVDPCPVCRGPLWTERVPEFNRVRAACVSCHVGVSVSRAGGDFDSKAEEAMRALRHLSALPLPDLDPDPPECVRSWRTVRMPWQSSEIVVEGRLAEAGADATAEEGDDDR